MVPPWVRDTWYQPEQWRGQMCIWAKEPPLDQFLHLATTFAPTQRLGSPKSSKDGTFSWEGPLLGTSYSWKGNCDLISLRLPGCAGWSGHWLWNVPGTQVPNAVVPRTFLSFEVQFQFGPKFALLDISDAQHWPRGLVSSES